MAAKQDKHTLELSSLSDTVQTDSVKNDKTPSIEMDISSKNNEAATHEMNILIEMYAQMELERTAQVSNKQANIRDAQNKHEMTLKQNIESPALATQFLSRYGLRGPEDISVFLDSPAGETVKEELGQILAEEKAMEEYQEFKRREAEKRRQRFLALLALYLASKSSHAKKLKDEFIKMADDLLESEKELIKEANEALLHDEGPDYESASEKIDELQRNLQENESEINDLEIEFGKLQEETLLLESHAEEGDALILGIESDFSNLIQNKPVSTLTDVEKHAASEEISAQLQDIQAKLNQKYGASSDETPDAFSITGDKFMQELGYKQRHLQNMQGLLAGTHLMYDMNFKRVESHDDAHLCMPEDMAEKLQKSSRKVVEKDGQHFLLSKNQKFEDLTPKQKFDAKEQYQKEISPEKHHTLKTHHKAQCSFKSAQLASRMETILARQEVLFSKQLELQTQLQQAQAWIASAKMSQKTGRDPSLMPKNPSAQQTSVTSSYRSVLSTIKDAPSSEDIQSMQSAYSDTSVNTKKLQPGKPISKDTLKEMQRTTLPVEAQQRLLKNLMAHQPELQKHLEKRGNNELSQQKKDSKPGAMSPFKMTPDPTDR